MEPVFLAYSIVFLALAVGTYTDIKTREVPDWINYGLIFSGVAVWLLYSLIYSDWDGLFNSLLGFWAFFVFALLMFYTGQWGGGDSKMIMGIGVLLGLDMSFVLSLFGFYEGNAPFPFILSFLINTLLVGAAYGILWSAFLAVKNIKRFMAEAAKIVKNQNIIMLKRIFFSAAALLALSLFFAGPSMRIMVLGIIALIFATFYMWVFVKSVENSSMYKKISPDKLTEGDWIAEEVKHKGRTICGPKDLGIEKSQIALLKRYKVKKVLVKEGIPFVPSFFIAFIISLYLKYSVPETIGNILFLFI